MWSRLVPTFSQDVLKRRQHVAFIASRLTFQCRIEARSVEQRSLGRGDDSLAFENYRWRRRCQPYALGVVGFALSPLPQAASLCKESYRQTKRNSAERPQQASRQKLTSRSVSEQPPHHTGQTSEVNAGYARLTSSRGGVVGDIGRIRSREKTQRNNRRTSRLICPCGTHATTSWASWTRPTPRTPRGDPWLTRASRTQMSLSSHRRSFPRGSSVRRSSGLPQTNTCGGWDTISTDEGRRHAAPAFSLRNPRSHDGCGEGARARPCQGSSRHHALAWRARHLVLPVVDDRGDVTCSGMMRPSLAHRSAVRCLGARLKPASHLQSQEVA